MAPVRGVSASPLGQAASEGRVPGPATAREAGRQEENPEGLRRAARDFEAMLAQQLLRGMLSSLPSGGMLGHGANAEMYEDLLEQSLARVMADRGALGVGDLLLRQLARVPARHALKIAFCGDD